MWVGVARSKTLAKLANHVGKKWPEFNSVCDFTAMSNEDLSALLKTIAVGEVWGVGGKINEILNGFDIHTVEDLKTWSPKLARSHFGVVMERTVNELNELSCLDLEGVVSENGI